METYFPHRVLVIKAFVKCKVVMINQQLGGIRVKGIMRLKLLACEALSIVTFCKLKKLRFGYVSWFVD